MGFQVHQSALNNLLEKLELDGRKFTLPELFSWIGDKLSRPQVTLPEDLPENVHVTFAPQDAVRIRCEDGRVEVILSIAELTQGAKKWRNFTARTYYKPQTESLRHRFDVVLSRSFGPPAATAECAAPFLAAGGHVVVSEPPAASGRARWPADGLQVVALERVELPVPVSHGFVVLRATALCDQRFPRRDGMPGKRPLWVERRAEPSDGDRV